MVTQHVPTLGRPRRTHDTQIGVVIAGIGISMVMAVAILTWRGALPAAAPSPVAAPVAAGAVAEAIAPATTAPLVYLTATEEEAVTLRSALVEQPMAEQPTLNAAFLPVTGAIQLMQIERLVADLNHWHVAEGLALIRLIDLRPASDSAATASETAEVEVSGQQQADRIAETRLSALGGADAPYRTSEGVAPQGGLAELYGEQEAEARATAAQAERMGGMAELYRDQAAAASSAR